MPIQPFHPYSIREIFIKGLFRQSKHAEHYGEKKEASSLSLQSLQSKERNGHVSTSHIGEFEIVAVLSATSNRPAVL